MRNSNTSAKVCFLAAMSSSRSDVAIPYINTHVLNHLVSFCPNDTDNNFDTASIEF
jgi:hypothetical protein